MPKKKEEKVSAQEMKKLERLKREAEQGECIPLGEVLKKHREQNHQDNNHSKNGCL
jgi:hypothetical protein